MPLKPVVMLVDDDCDLLRLLSIRLCAAGYEVKTVTSGEEALECIGQVDPDAVVTDLQMGGMDGIALFEAIHARQPSLPVLVLTAHGTIPDAFDAANRGVFSYLTKPFNSQVLLSHLERAVGPVDGAVHASRTLPSQ